MKFLVLILVCCTGGLSSAKSADPFKVRDCHPGPGILSIRRFEVSPDPVSMSKNITASLDLELHDDFPPNTYIKKKIYKVTSLFGFPIHIPAPCVVDVGSCTTEACKYIDSFNGSICPFFPPDAKCGCPLRAGNYRGEKVTLRMPEMGPFIKWFASGDFMTELKVVKKEASTEKQIACIEITGSLVP